MKHINEFLNSLRDSLVDWPSGTIPVILLLLLVGIIVGLIIWGLFIATDSWFLQMQKGQGKIISKSFTPAYTQYLPIYNVAIGTTLPQPSPHADTWSITVDIEGLQDTISIDEKYYHNLSLNEIINLTYAYKRISKKLSIGSIYVSK